MTIARRLIILVAIPLLILLGQGYFGRSQLSRLGEQTRYLTETQVPGLAAVGRISRTMTEMRVSARANLLAVDEAARGAAQADFDAHKASLSYQLFRYGETFRGDA